MTYHIFNTEEYRYTDSLEEAIQFRDELQGRIFKIDEEGTYREIFV